MKTEQDVEQEKEKTNRSGSCTYQIWIIHQTPPPKLAQQNNYRNEHRVQTSTDPFSGSVQQKSTRSPLRAPSIDAKYRDMEP